MKVTTQVVADPKAIAARRNNTPSTKEAKREQMLAQAKARRVQEQANQWRKEHIQSIRNSDK